MRPIRGADVPDDASRTSRRSGADVAGVASDPRLLSAGELASLIRARRLSSREAVDAHIAQIERVNPVLNALVRARFDEARAEADAADRAHGELPPLHGVPCTIKECFALVGMPHSGGLFARRHVVAERDATAVARLRAAGAIPLGVTNVSELCMWMESDNRVYGRSNNPYDPTRIVGGSSGGEGAIIAAGASPFGLGSDVGGSIRMPAFFNGVFGHKPSGGLVPGTGQHPMAENAALRYLTTGPLCRRAADLMPLLRILAGPDGIDAGCTPMPLGDPAAVELRGRTLLDVPDDGRAPVDDAIRAAQERGMRALERAGMRVRTLRFAGLRRQFDIWSAMMLAADQMPFRRHLGEGRPIPLARELVKLTLRRSDHTLIALLLAITESVPKLVPPVLRRALEDGRRLHAEIVDALGPDGVLLYPPYTVPAPRHGEPVRWALRLHMPWAYAGIVNVLELPATQVPAGLDGRGLPVGFQVVSRHGNDHVTIAAALALEDALGGWVPPRLAGLDAS